MRKFKLTSVLTLVFVLASCSSLHKPHDIVEIPLKPTPEKVVIEKPTEPEKPVVVVNPVEVLKNKSNNVILANDEYKKEVFDRSKRNINKDMRGVWVSTVLHLDFPTKPGFDANTQMREIDNIVSNVKSWGLNAIFLQVKPSSDAFYNSKILPWSMYLTGQEGATPSYDPLRYFIKKAHENGIELHAWINPYRVAMTTDYNKLANTNIAKIHPEWVFEYNGRLYLNPAKKGVVEYLSTAIEEIVKNYDVDGIHLDDYFYPYPAGKPIPYFDRQDFENSGYRNLGDFRRDNVNKLISNLSVSVHKLKPKILFGVSPFGIWRNAKTDPEGSYTNGLQTYDDLYADPIKWMQNGWVDYVAPQIYWNIGHSKADYKTLVNWWSNEGLKTNTPVYIGEGAYKADRSQYSGKDAWDYNELERHILIRKNNPGVDGFIIFRYKTLLNNPRLINEMR